MSNTPKNTADMLYIPAREASELSADTLARLFMANEEFNAQFNVRTTRYEIKTGKFWAANFDYPDDVHITGRELNNTAMARRMADTLRTLFPMYHDDKAGLGYEANKAFYHNVVDLIRNFLIDAGLIFDIRKSK